MTALRRRWVASLLGAGLLLLLLVIVSLDDLYRTEPPQRIGLREVRIYESPPPPPPAPTDRRDPGSFGPSLALAQRDNPITLDMMELEVKLSAGALGNAGGGGFGFGEGAGVGLGIVSLSDLDQLPIVLSAPPLVYPKEADERGMRELEVTIHIVIDEQGRTHPIRVVETPFPSLDGEFEDYASKVRFSVPTRAGIPVRTEYLWPLLIKRE